jgi:SAM-dependent methyltransferase
MKHWFALLDNFRRVPKRTDKLYGEGIIPITDRERATYLSPAFGRMVFTKIMTPVVDRGSGRIIGWTVVLNINSVNKRHEFFEQLYATIARETKRIRFAAGYDGLFDAYAPRRALLDRHERVLAGLTRVLDLGCGTGSLSVRLVADGARVTAVDGDTHLLRRARDRVAPLGGARFIRRDPDLLGELPAARYDGVALVNLLPRLTEPAVALAQAYKSLKPGGVMTLSAMLPSGCVDFLYNSLRTALERDGKYENLKHQFNCVLELDREQARGWTLRSREEVRALVLEAGFAIASEEGGLEDGNTLFLVARKA